MIMRHRRMIKNDLKRGDHGTTANLQLKIRFIKFIIIKKKSCVIITLNFVERTQIITFI